MDIAAIEEVIQRLQTGAVTADAANQLAVRLTNALAVSSANEASDKPPSAPPSTEPTMNLQPEQVEFMPWFQ